MEGQVKKDTKNFGRIMRGLEEVVDIAEGRAEPARVFAPENVDVKAIRKKTGFSQDAFAGRYGFSLGSVRDWEQGRSAPVAAAKLLLVVIDKEPEAVQRALGSPEYRAGRMFEGAQTAV